jgi:hypothetical protein
MLLYMQNPDEQASALFSDATCDLLLADGCRLIAEALQRLNISTVSTPRPYVPPRYTPAYLIQFDPDSTDMSTYLDKEIGTRPKLFFTTSVLSRGREASADFLPICAEPIVAASKSAYAFNRERFSRSEHIQITIRSNRSLRARLHVHDGHCAESVVDAVDFGIARFTCDYRCAADERSRSVG